MDPVTIIGLAASAAQLSDLAIKAVKALNQYTKDIKSAPVEVAELQHEVQIMTNVLEGFDDTLNAIPSSVEIPLDSLKSAAEGAIAVLKEVLCKLEERSALSRSKGFRRLTWPFEKGDTKKMIDRVQRYKQTLSLIGQIQQTYILCIHCSLTS